MDLESFGGKPTIGKTGNIITGHSKSQEGKNRDGERVTVSPYLKDGVREKKLLRR